MPNKEKSQDFELIELLMREADSDVASTSTQQRNGFESFKARFQSYIDQIPSYLHSVSKEGFFPHFFLGSFSTLIDTEIAKRLEIEKIYFRFDSTKTLQVAVIKQGKIDSVEDAIDKVKLFVITESSSARKKFSYGELDKILGNDQITRNNFVRLARDKGKLGVKLVEITKEKDAKGKMAGISVNVESNKLDNDSSTTHEFKEIKKGLWNNPESDIAKLTNSNAGKVKESVEEIFKKVSRIHSEHENSLAYGKEAREAAHHGFIAGVLMNFRYRHNLRVYLEQFAGRGYADIVLVPRGKDRSLNAIPIIIEIKAATKAELKEGKIGEKSGTTPAAALKQAEDYTKGFQPNVMRVLTTANDILCVGVNFDHPSPISDIIAKSRNQKITPLFNEILESIDEHNNGKIDEGELKERIQNNIERIYHTFPGTGDNHYFSRFLLGQSLLLNEVKALESSFDKYVFVYGENIPTEAQPEPKSHRLKDQKKSKGQDAEQPSKLDQSHGVTTMVLIPKNDKKSIYVMNIVETDGRTEVLKKGTPLDQLKQKVGNRKIVELDLNFNVKEKSNFEKYFSMEVKEPISLEQYNNKKTDKFNGSFENVPYPNKLKETFDGVLKSQHIDQSASKAPNPEKLKELLEKVGEGMFPFKSSIEKEAHFQAVLHGAFSHYSDIKLGELPENRALILTEFQTGRGKRIDMLFHGIKFKGHDGNAKEYSPIGLELKGPRKGKTADDLKDEANKQITDEYTKGVTYKTLTDGREVDFIGVVFDKGEDKAKLVTLTTESFKRVSVTHSSIYSFSQQGCPKGRKQRSIGMACIDSFDEEKITEKEKKNLVKELFGIEAYDREITVIDSIQVSIDSGKVNIEFKDNNGSSKKLIIDSAPNIKSIENYVLDEKNLEVKLKVSSNKEYSIIEEIKGQGTEYYLRVDEYKAKFDNIIKDFTTDAEKGLIYKKLHQLSNDRQLLESKKHIEEIGSIEDVKITDQDYYNIINEIKQELLAKGVRKDIFDRFTSHLDDLGEKVFAEYISDVERNLNEKGIACDRDKFDSAKIKGAKGGKFFTAIKLRESDGLYCKIR